MQSKPAILLAATTGLMLTGCVERQIRVTSEPSGARVWINDQEIGTTPCEAGFTFYGGYDIRLEKQGYEPIHALRTAKAPLHEYPAFDLIATATPKTESNTIEWNFILDQVAEHSSDPELALSELIERASELQSQAEAVPAD